MSPSTQGAYDDVVGQRSGTASAIAVISAFVQRKSWTQADLARAVGLRTEALRRVLDELDSNGIRILREPYKNQVYCKVSPDWHPAGVVFTKEHIPELMRQLSRVRNAKARETLLRIVLNQVPGRGQLALQAPVVARTETETEEQYLPTVEHAAAAKVALFMKYVSTSRGGTVSERHVSVHEIDDGPPARFIATCHRSGALRWFRVENVVRARPEPGETFRACDPSDVAAFRAESLDGFKGSGEVQERSFFVREPESSWVVNNLLPGMKAEVLSGGARVTARTSAVLRLARFVVSLGEAARAEDAVLAGLVVEIGEGAAKQARGVLDGAASQLNSGG